MKKEEYVRRYGVESYERYRKNIRIWLKKHASQVQEIQKISSAERNRKNGKYYAKKRQFETTGIQRVKRLVRAKHQKRWNKYKQIIAPNSELHHEWIPNSGRYRGVALVDKEKHRHGVINPIQIIEGKIMLFSEPEIRRVGK